LSKEADVAALLSGTRLFGAMPSQPAAAFARRFREERFERGAMIFARGDAGDRLYVVGEGQVRLAIGANDGRELSFQIVGVGDLFGEIAVLDGGTRSAEAVAIAPTVAFHLSRADFEAVQGVHPEVARTVIVYLCQRLREISDKLETLALYPLDVRLARYLATALRGRPEIPGRRLPLELRFSQSELAQLIGASRPKINLALAALEEAGAIGRTSDRLFCDRKRLLEIAQWES
jgi:CRP/FNR family transcriptional regulator, cyclic AMP receptor protein